MKIKTKIQKAEFRDSRSEVRIRNIVGRSQESVTWSVILNQKTRSQNVKTSEGLRNEPLGKIDIKNRKSGVSHLN